VQQRRISQELATRVKGEINKNALHSIGARFLKKSADLLVVPHGSTHQFKVNRRLSKALWYTPLQGSSGLFSEDNS